MAKVGACTACDGLQWCQSFVLVFQEHLLTLPESKGLAVREGVHKGNEVPLQLL